MRRVAVTVRGTVQGVGFRPFLHAAASRRQLDGWVRNRRNGIEVEVQGADGAVRDFLCALERDAPVAARVERVDVEELPAIHGEVDVPVFRILPSIAGAEPRATLPADLATCAACAAETADPGSRRFRYPFTACTQCGPRYSVVETLPWDRGATTLRDFPLCEPCAREYADPSDRRFHAETAACPACGPELSLLGPDGSVRARGDQALGEAVVALRAGKIVALEGLGGFQLLVDATSEEAVARLRARKERPHKPFAILFASAAELRAAACASEPEIAALGSPAAPILLVERAPAAGRCRAPGSPAGAGPGAGGGPLAANVAPDVPSLGVMLPATPLHRMLADGVGRPLVCTSGNLSEEPICIDPGEALARLGAVADLFLVHDRRIARPVDDSLARVGPAGLEVLRRARGFAPVAVRAAGVPAGIVALGAQQKATVALSLDGEVVVSQHLGDLHTAEGAALLERTLDDLLRLLAVRPRVVACDLHPDYVSTHAAARLAARFGLPLERVQHHHAHVAACLAEHAVEGPVLGLAWDGAGLGDDGSLWGGEALLVEGAAFRRIAHLRAIPLVGGERAIREPRRVALALLYGLSPERAVAWAGRSFAPSDARILTGLLQRGFRTVPATSIGRLFDGIAALAGLGGVASYEGQVAMCLERVADEAAGDLEPYRLPLGSGEPAVADWAPLVAGVLEDLESGVLPSVVAARFHAALAALAGEMALRAGVARVALAGGCFQNRRLSRAVRARLEALGLEVLAPCAFPPNDGGISLGQVLVAAHRRKERGNVPRDSG